MRSLAGLAASATAARLSSTTETVMRVPLMQAMVDVRVDRYVLAPVNKVGLPPRLTVEYLYGVSVELLGFLVAVADADGAELAVLREGADEVEDDALLAGGIEVEAVVDGDVYEVVGGEALVVGALEVVRGVVVAGLRRRGAVEAVVGVVDAVGEEAQDQVGVRGPALSQVDLDGRVLPAVPPPHRDKVDGEPPQRAALLQDFADPLARLLEVPAVGRVGGEGGAEEDLAGRPAEDLVVGRDDRGLPDGVYAALDGGGTYLISLHPGLHDAAHLPELALVVLPALARGLEPGAHRQLPLDPAGQGLALRRALAGEDGVALAGEPLVELYGDAAQARVAALELDHGLADVLAVAQVLEAVG